MAQGFLGRADLLAATPTLLFTSDATPQTFNVRFANRNATPAAVRIAITSGGAPAAADWVEYDMVLPANGIIDDNPLVASNGEAVYVYSSLANVSVRAHGM